jgi:hypothetical protein
MLSNDACSGHEDIWVPNEGTWLTLRFGPWYLFNRKLGGPQSRSGRFWRREYLPPLLGLETRTVQPVESRHSDWANHYLMYNRTLHAEKGDSNLKWPRAFRNSALWPLKLWKCRRCERIRKVKVSSLLWERLDIVRYATWKHLLRAGMKTH